MIVGGDMYGNLDIFLFFDLVFPCSMIIVGIMFYNNRNKKINIFSGYRSDMSMKNNNTWKFANEYLGNLLKNLGISLFIITLFISFGFINNDSESISIQGIIIYIVQVFIIIASVISVEYALKKNFDKEGNKISNKIN